MSNRTLNLVTVIISYDIDKDQKYVVSTEETKIVFPSIELNEIDGLTNRTISIIGDLFLNTGYALQFLQDAQFIDINNAHLSSIYEDSAYNIYIIYGVMCSKLDLKDGNNWYPFDYLDANNIDALNIMSKVIERTI
jgi:hypothetical protein